MRNGNAISSTLWLANLLGSPEAKTATLEEPSAIGFSYPMEESND
jgi:hypothetical protein